MGFFGDIRKLKQQAKEIGKTWDPAAEMARTMETMQAAGLAMEQQAAAAAGEPATAQVNLARDTGHLLNNQPIVELSLLVFREGRPPYPVTCQQIVPLTQLAKLAPGYRLAVKVDPRAPQSVWIDWAAS